MISSFASRNRFAPLADSEEMPSTGRAVVRKQSRRSSDHNDCPGVNQVFRSPTGHLYDFFTCTDSDTVSLAMQKSMQNCNATMAYEPIRWNWWPFPVKTWWTWGATLSLYSQMHHVPEDDKFLKCIDAQGRETVEQAGQINLKKAGIALGIMFGVVGGVVVLGGLVYGAALCLEGCGDMLASRRERARYRHDLESVRRAAPTERTSLLG